MKRFLFLLLSVVCMISCNRLATNDWKADELKGEVKHITTTTGEAVQQGDTLLFGRYTYTEEVFYDKRGLKTHAMTLDDSGALNLQCRYEHDKSGNITVADMRDADDKPVMRNIFEYDERGYLVKMLSVDPDNHTDMTIVYERDSAGSQTKQTVYDHLGRVVYSEATELPADSVPAHYEYDEQGNWIRKTAYHTDSVGVEYPTFMWIREIEYY